ncbi:JAB domain-containing protein [Paenibacillus sp. FSL E2-0274]|uniref:JAB domain-containing protein n=1 Tax=Paenibacillus TaxID=44249 RepID=UPI00096F19B2|nr:JAB domain-containing protein [Paenibacillus odorifer]OMD12616.1 DNA repair protein RadC [Paenibacillus odorifer]OME36236.1 DNA repair protein RadC [Paenibacillus odorifer]
MSNTQPQPAKRVEFITLRMVREKASLLYPNRVIRSPKDAADLFRPFIGDCDRETFCIVCLNTKNEPTALHQVSCGTLNTALVHPRETFKLAVLANSASIICCHNHPSGNAEPSSEDVDMTKRLRDAGDLLGIQVLDHVIIGEDSFVSMKECGLM